MKAKKRTQSRTALAKASMRNARVAPRKARLVIDQIRGLNVTNAIAMLENTRRSSNPIVCNVLKSAVANAMEKNSAVNPDDLNVIEARVDGARTLKRIRPRAMGRATQILKRSCHIHLSVG
jgi:large subunit ribosomal protein L22